MISLATLVIAGVLVKFLFFCADDKVQAPRQRRWQVLPDEGDQWTYHPPPRS